MTQYAVARLAQLDEHRPCACRPVAKNSSSSAKGSRYTLIKATAPMPGPHSTKV